jgi:siroheme synthase
MTGVLVGAPAACACAGIQLTHRSSATQNAATDAPKRARTLARSPGTVRSEEK